MNLGTLASCALPDGRGISGVVKPAGLGYECLPANKGWVAEWSIAHAWKACVPQGTGGSNPPPSGCFFATCAGRFPARPRTLTATKSLGPTSELRPARVLGASPKVANPKERGHPARWWTKRARRPRSFEEAHLQLSELRPRALSPEKTATQQGDLGLGWLATLVTGRIWSG